LSYLFDSNAIFLAFKRGKEDILIDEYTINLAYFELGNVIWKELFIHKSINKEEAEELINILSDILSLMKIIDMSVLDIEVLRFAYESGLTYYDASYAYAALSNDLILVTEDKRLRNAIRNKVKVVSINDVKKT